MVERCPVAGSESRAVQNVDRAFDGFFEKRSGFPEFKKKHSSVQSFWIPQNIKVKDGEVFVHPATVRRWGERERDRAQAADKKVITKVSTGFFGCVSPLPLFETAITRSPGVTWPALS